MNIKPLSNYVFIEPLNEEKMTKTGIIIPDTAEEKPMIGKVMAIGPGKIDEDGDSIPMSVKIGDKILFTKYAPHELKVEEKKYLVIREDEILAIIE